MTKIDIFSGFLGAGKTTLIKKLLKEALHDTKVVLIENEFGEIGIDGGFLKESGIEIKEMNSGCICCSLVGDFGTSLKEVLSTYAPERILIEPSGVGKLSDVVKAVDDVAKDMDVQIGMGAIVMGLASIVIGEVIFGRYGSFLKRLIAIIVGSIIYRIIIAIVIQLGLSTDDLKLLTAFIVALALTIPVLMANRKQTANYKKLTKEVDEKNA